MLMDQSCSCSPLQPVTVLRSVTVADRSAGSIPPKYPVTTTRRKWCARDVMQGMVTVEVAVVAVRLSHQQLRTTLARHPPFDLAYAIIYSFLFPEPAQLRHHHHLHHHHHHHTTTTHKDDIRHWILVDSLKRRGKKYIWPRDARDQWSLPISYSTVCYFYIFNHNLYRPRRKHTFIPP